MTEFDAYHKMKELLTNYYIEAKTTKAKPIAWITSGAPVEFLYAMDILPVWFKMRRLEKFFEEQKCTLVVTTYANSWSQYSNYPVDPNAEPYEAIAKSYLNVYINTGFEDRINYLASLIDEFSLTGFIMHSNRSCKPYSVGMYRMQEELAKISGKPGVVIEADQNDPRAYSDAQVETRLEAFIESMVPI